MTIRQTIPVLIIAMVTMGAAGPCDILGMGGEESDSGVPEDCGEILCDHQLLVEVLRADNEAFWAGSYRFMLETPDTEQYFIECYLSHPEEGFECSMGDLDIIDAVNDPGTGKIWLVIAGAPASVLVTLEHDGWVIGERVLVPEYEENKPNGDECPPVCYVGEDSMAVESW